MSMKTIPVVLRAGAGLAALALVVALAGVLDAPTRAADKPRNVTFVNDADHDVYVHVRTGASGEVGTCAAKPSENTFELRGGKDKDRRDVDGEGYDICWCSRPSSEGPINERRDCSSSWNRAPGGQEVHVR
jgi:hypothetical protein